MLWIWPRREGKTDKEKEVQKRGKERLRSSRGQEIQTHPQKKTDHTTDRTHRYREKDKRYMDRDNRDGEGERATRPTLAAAVMSSSEPRKLCGLICPVASRAAKGSAADSVCRWLPSCAIKKLQTLTSAMCAQGGRERERDET